MLKIGRIITLAGLALLLGNTSGNLLQNQHPLSVGPVNNAGKLAREARVQTVVLSPH
jgi:hypothetical protein